MTSLDSHNMFPSLPRSLHEELISQQQAKLRGLVPSSSPMLSPMIGGMPPGASNADALSKLTPSVYSHPTAVQDPVLNKTSMDFLRSNASRTPLDMTSSGAFFDHKAVSSGSGSKSLAPTTNLRGPEGPGSNNSSTDIIAKLTKEMLLSDANASGVAASPIATSSTATTSTSNTNNSPQSIINKLNLSPAKTKTDLSNADKDLAALKSSLAARKAAAQNNPSRLSLAGTSNGSKVLSGSEGENVSKSQPDLFTGIDQQPQQQPGPSPLDHPKNNPVYANTSDIASLMQQMQQHQEAASQQQQHHMSATDLHQLETLKAENDRLRTQMSDYAKKINRVASLEQEMAKIHQAYQSLLKHSEKREMLEKSARAKLHAVIINLSDANKEVTERHDAVMAQLMSGEPKNQNIPGLDSILRGEIMRKDGLIRQLMDQNKMLLTTKERQEVEMAALNETLEVCNRFSSQAAAGQSHLSSLHTFIFQEQRAHIQFLGTALSNAEANVVRLEEENRLKEGYAERVKQMTRSLDQLQKASEKREAMEKKLRAKLEEELKELRDAQKGNLADGHMRTGDSVEDLRRKWSEAEEKVQSNFLIAIANFLFDVL